MKVLMINSVCGIRSTGRICTDLAVSLDAHGHNVKIAYGREEVPEQFRKYAIKIGTDYDVRVHGFLARTFDASGYGSKGATKRFIEWVKTYNPDVIHLHNLHGYYINIEILFNYLRNCGKKVIWTLHDCWAFTGHSAYCDAIGCEKWKICCNHCPNKKEYPRSYIDRSEKNWKRKKDILTGIANLTIVTPSYWLADLVRNSFLAEYPVEVIHNGIDTNEFHSVKSNFRDDYGIGDKFILLGVATSWNNMKGLTDFIKLADMLNDRYQIVLVGVTQEQKKAIPGKIKAIERTNSIRELANIYSAADLFLNLSYCENYPTVNLEAIACGTPILTYRTGGSPEIAEKYNGMVIERGDLTAVVEAVKTYKKEGINNKNPMIDRDSIDKKAAVGKYQELLGCLSDS